MLTQVLGMLDERKDVMVKGVRVKGRDLLPAVKLGRKAMKDDMYRRWVTEPKEVALEQTTVAARKKTARKNERLRKFMVSTLLHPRYKQWEFKGSHLWSKEQAFTVFKEEFLANWAPAAPAPPPRQAVAPTGAHTRHIYIASFRSEPDSFILSSATNLRQSSCLV